MRQLFFVLLYICSAFPEATWNCYGQCLTGKWIPKGLGHMLSKLGDRRPELVGFWLSFCEHIRNYLRLTWHRGGLVRLVLFDWDCWTNSRMSWSAFAFFPSKSSIMGGVRLPKKKRRLVHWLDHEKITHEESLFDSSSPSRSFLLLIACQAKRKCWINPSNLNNTGCLRFLGFSYVSWANGRVGALGKCYTSGRNALSSERESLERGESCRIWT